MSADAHNPFADTSTTTFPAVTASTTEIVTKADLKEKEAQARKLIEERKALKQVADKHASWEAERRRIEDGKKMAETRDQLRERMKLAEREKERKAEIEYRQYAKVVRDRIKEQKRIRAQNNGRVVSESGAGLAPSVTATTDYSDVLKPTTGVACVATKKILTAVARLSNGSNIKGGQFARCLPLREIFGWIRSQAKEQQGVDMPHSFTISVSVPGGVRTFSESADGSTAISELGLADRVRFIVDE
eukprot:gnl/Carplike_NY0171/2281_a3075_345.p1 GENE.gnl/Carplike_NY0171/2281_a3075_345~~gnl/Carplike_NY0171/2281_a3075_345.p1  ORF type:complete len:288 (+),score=86.21 gnl/Carplike_NY0171/2281_a3075_345:128-865(+)